MQHELKIKILIDEQTEAHGEPLNAWRWERISEAQRQMERVEVEERELVAA